MAIPLQVLIVEDNERDAALLVRELRRGGYDVTHARVETEREMRETIGTQRWDIILSDFSMPKFSASAALSLVVEAGLDIPFIIVSGAVGEETAASVMRAGAQDFVLKSNIKRLVPAVARELNAAQVRRERRSADEKLDFERKLLQQLMNGSPDAISLKDLERRYIRLNDAERLTLNVEKDREVFGELADAFVSPERAKLRRDDEERVLATGQPVIDSLEKIVGDDNAVRWLSTTRAPIRGPDGEITGIVAIARDITENKRQEQMKDEFVATVSHELRTPLTSIIGALGLLSNGIDAAMPDSKSRLLQIAQQNCQRLARIVNDVLDFERIQSDQMTFDKRLVDVHELVTQIIEINQVYARNCGVRVRLDDAAAQCFVATDPARLEQIITNLLSNAIKFSPHDAEVVVMIEDAANDLRISVRDRGPGIPAEYKDRIFERFVQVDATDARAKGGTGLGLAIAKQMAVRLGAEIDLETVPDQGSTFRVTLHRLQSSTG